MKIHSAEHNENQWTFTVRTDDGLHVHVHCHMGDPEEASIGDWGEVDATDDVLVRVYVVIDSKIYGINDVIREVSMKAPRIIDETLAEEAANAALEREMKEITR